jgi:hypothetical protein
VQRRRGLPVGNPPTASRATHDGPSISGLSTGRAAASPPPCHHPSPTPPPPAPASRPGRRPDRRGNAGLGSPPRRGNAGVAARPGVAARSPPGPARQRRARQPARLLRITDRAATHGAQIMRVSRSTSHDERPTPTRTRTRTPTPTRRSGARCPVRKRSRPVLDGRMNRPHGPRMAHHPAWKSPNGFSGGGWSTPFGLNRETARQGVSRRCSLSPRLPVRSGRVRSSRRRRERRGSFRGRPPDGGACLGRLEDERP